MASHALKDNPKSVAAIEELRSKWHDFFNAKRIKELCDHFYTEDTVCIPPDHDLVWGKAATRALLQGYADMGNVAFKLGVVETHADDHTGYLIGNYVFYDRRSGKEVSVEGRTLETYRKEPDGSWKCTVDMWHDLDAKVVEKPLPR